MTCKGCEKREVGCHAKCEDYKAYRQVIEEKRQAKAEAMAKDNQHRGYLKSVFDKKAK